MKGSARSVMYLVNTKTPAKVVGCLLERLKERRRFKNLDPNIVAGIGTPAFHQPAARKASGAVQVSV